LVRIADDLEGSADIKIRLERKYGEYEVRCWLYSSMYQTSGAVNQITNQVNISVKGLKRKETGRGSMLSSGQSGAGWANCWQPGILDLYWDGKHDVFWEENAF
jgi:hypothetical protein